MHGKVRAGPCTWCADVPMMRSMPALSIKSCARRWIAVLVPKEHRRRSRPKGGEGEKRQSELEPGTLGVR